ncbi:hypothetical protein [Bifidobacterium callitrichidarum]|uniref:Uncharacterized protein n=1 Tax=Bifidobacterium callitrichidarum TaxID=2052941 RepID=A0A2U2N1Y1_9BIFI|nr:hypothetical protein [Bifidobacterium callitrichidarum]PWG63196.1 hypothetical protein DF196_11150 [Bifidobacterium callitrichidarum]
MEGQYPVDADAASTMNDVVQERDWTMLRRIRVKALIWTVLLVIVFAVAVFAWFAPKGTALAKAYGYLAIAALAVFIVAVTYLVGWSRGSSQLHATSAGDEIWVRYTLEGPVFGSMEWWWTAPPVNPDLHRRKVLIIGILLVVVALIFAAGGIAGAVLAPALFSRIISMAMVLIAVPPLSAAVAAFSFLHSPTSANLRWFIYARRFSFWFTLVAAAIVLLLSDDATQTASMLGLMAVMWTLVAGAASGMRNAAETSLMRRGAFAEQRSGIDRDLRRMAAENPQTVFDPTGMDQVRKRRERKLAIRYTLGVAAFILVIVIEVLVKLLLER